ncbi:hypothetical protein [Cellulosimicrobium sp. JZ28]|uniref:hypothetical protein n=1 Tax=Cellulosimicrobium sp. JZ28 TaxID=1906273 RepID=UPI00188B3E73|nr:hypothetical protein [Cellulosimicrobium sp. JZ28]
MTALVALERGYVFQTLVAAVRLEHDGVDEHDVEPDAPEPGGDPGPMPTPTDHEETHVSDERTAEHDPCEAEALALLTPTLAGWREAFGRFLVRHDVDDPDALLAEFDRVIAKHDAEERERIATAIEGLPTTWPNGVKHSAAWMRLEAADVAREGAPS